MHPPFQFKDKSTDHKSSLPMLWDTVMTQRKCMIVYHVTCFLTSSQPKRASGTFVAAARFASAIILHQSPTIITIIIMNVPHVMKALMKRRQIESDKMLTIILPKNASIVAVDDH
jgi:hypothetical protein